MSAEIAVTSSPVVATVYAHLLDAIQDGTLQPGTRLSDGELAAQFGVSRTPVREALQKLREIGVVEASANRFTRVAVITPGQLIDAMAVWVALYRALVHEVIDAVTPEMLEQMADDSRNYLALLPKQDYLRIAAANSAFFSRPFALSTNPVLLRSLTGVVHMIRLGSLHLPRAIDLAQLGERQQALLTPLRDHDLAGALQVIESLREIRIPQE